MRTIPVLALSAVVALTVLSACDELRRDCGEEGWTLVPVVVFNRDMVAGAVMDYDCVVKKAMPEKFVTPSMVKPSNFEKVLGKKLAIPAQRGDLVLLQFFHLGSGKEPTQPGPVTNHDTVRDEALRTQLEAQRKQTFGAKAEKGAP